MTDYELMKKELGKRFEQSQEVPMGFCDLLLIKDGKTGREYIVYVNAVGGAVLLDTHKPDIFEKTYEKQEGNNG